MFELLIHGCFLRRWVGSLCLRQFPNHFSRFDLCGGVDAVAAFAKTGVATRPCSGGS